MNDNSEREARAYRSLTGLSVGDAFGQLFFQHDSMRLFGKTGSKPTVLPAAPWRWTDDTHMAGTLYEHLRVYGEVRPDELAMSFGTAYLDNPDRAYGAAMHDLLRRYAQGAAWHLEARKLFTGQGSYGNGSAMRVAPLGAYFADDLNRVQTEAARSAEVTHAHEEAIAGAIAVAVASAIAWQVRSATPNRADFIDAVLDYVPLSEVRMRLAQARDARDVLTTYTAAQMLGNGSQISNMDTVPFAIFSAADNLTNYQSALWLTAEALGDIDTTCAIVGGIVVNHTGADAIPLEWLKRREPLPKSVMPA